MKLSKLAHKLKGQPMFKVQQKIDELRDLNRDILQFEIGSCNMGTPPEVLHSTIISLLCGETQYTNSCGIEGLKDDICKRFYNETEFYIKPEQIVVMSANSGIDYVVRCLCDTDDEVLLVAPYFPTYSSVLDYNGIKHTDIIPSNGLRLRAEDLIITDKTKLLILNSPCNPSGEIISKEELLKIYELAEKHDFYILTDDVYSELYYNEKPYSLIEKDGCNKRVIQLQSFSKLFGMSGFRMGYCIAPLELAEKIGLLFQTIDSCMPIFTQRAAQTALENIEELSEYRREYLYENRMLMCDHFRKLAVFDFEEPDGGTYLLVNIKKLGMTGEEFALELLEKEGVSVLPGSSFGKGFEDYIRLCFDTSPAIINKGMEKIGYFINGRGEGI